MSSSGHDLIDEWGHPVPDPTWWPSTFGGPGFKPIADSIHQMGLKFSIHIMRGISTQVVKANSPILGPMVSFSPLFKFITFWELLQFNKSNVTFGLGLSAQSKYNTLHIPILLINGHGI